MRTRGRPARATRGERLAYALLSNGVRVVGVNAGHTFSFVRDAAEDLRWARVPAAGSQFRSRDLFPEAAADIALGRPGALGEEMESAAIPGILENRLAYVDGNLKTTIEGGTASIESGAAVRGRVGNEELTATASNGSFGVEEGELAFAPGSSGWRGSSGAETVWMEFFLRGGSAWERFGCPPLGSEIELEADD